MIPILFDKTETAFTSNGIGRLRDCISCIVTEERNGIYECDFEYPMDGANYELIQVGRIVGVRHDESSDIQPFDIVSFTKPIDGVVTFHCVHISYRQTRLTVTATNINSLTDAFTALGNAVPTNPFSYTTDKTSSGYLSSADGIPHSVREILGGMQGSILDIYGGEYEWDKWQVKLHSSRGQQRDFSIRYGVNMLEYNDELDSSSCYSSCIPYWTDGENTVIGSMQTNGVTPTGRGECVPLDVSDRFESQPTQAQVEAEGLSYMQNNNTANPSQNIKVSFVRLQDMGEFADYQNLLQCKLCDTINVIFPDYNTDSNFKIVKTVWNVLTGKYDEMELGDLSVSLAEALGVNSSSYVGSTSGGGGAIVGEIKAYGGTTIPSGWLECDGTAVSRTTYSALFTAIGTLWGSGDGSTTFNLPNLKGRVPVGYDSADTNFDVVGESGGASTVTLTINEIPNHGHIKTDGSVYWYTGVANNNRGTSSWGWQAKTVSDFLQNVGGGKAHNNLQPYAVVKYIICTG